MMRSIWWPVIIIASAIGAERALSSGSGAPIQPLLVSWFLLICPGMAFVRLLRIEERATEVLLAIALSIAIDMIAAEILLYAEVWSAAWVLSLLIGISLAGVALQIITALVHEAGTAEHGKYDRSRLG